MHTFVPSVLKILNFYLPLIKSNDDDDDDLSRPSKQCQMIEFDEPLSFELELAPECLPFSQFVYAQLSAPHHAISNEHNKIPHNPDDK